MTDVYRAIKVPRKSIPPSRIEIEALTGWSRECSHLTDVQIECLHEARTANGLVASAGVGCGKSLISLLLATVMSKTRPLILVKSNLVANLEREYAKWRDHYRIIPFRLMTYDQLSLAKNALVLDGLDVDLIVCDEAHLLKHATSARTNRVLTKIVRDQPAVAILTGTLTTRSVADYAHTAEAALRDNSPIPHFDDSSCAAWRRVMGSMPDPQQYDWEHVRPLCQRYMTASDAFSSSPSSSLRDGSGSTIEHARAALQTHLRTTSGVVLTTEASCRASLNIAVVTEPVVPKEVEALMSDDVDPDGNPVSLMEADVIARQLQYGFWYRRTPIPNDPALVDHWRREASAWGRCLRAWLQDGGASGADSPKLAREAARRGELGQYAHECLMRFEAVEGLIRWEREAVWIWFGFVDAQVAYVQAATEPVILWYRHVAVGDALEERLNIPRYARGATAPTTAHHALMSIPAMSQGHNLQAWRRMRVGQAPADAGVWQQLLGRVHRLGQEADEVEVEVVATYKFAKKSLATARRAAEYVQQTTGERQRLALATWA